MTEEMVTKRKEAQMPHEARGTTYLTVSELAELLDVHRNSVIYWINNGQIEAVRRGLAKKSPFLIPMEEANRIMAEFANGAAS